jgi:hypothetical protein
MCEDNATALVSIEDRSLKLAEYYLSGRCQRIGIELSLSADSANFVVNSVDKEILWQAIRDCSDDLLEFVDVIGIDREELRKLALTPPEPTVFEERFLSPLKSAISAIPLVGGSIAESMADIVTLRTKQQFRTWYQIVFEELVDMRKHIDGLAADLNLLSDVFLQTLMYAAQIASRTYQEEKREALRNVVLNSALSTDIEADLQHMFLNFVDALTPSHLRVLATYANTANGELPAGHIERNIEIWRRLFPEIGTDELENRTGFYIQVFRDLQQRGLIRAPGNFSEVSASTLIADARSCSVTVMGRRFTEFITRPALME